MFTSTPSSWSSSAFVPSGVDVAAIVVSIIALTGLATSSLARAATQPQSVEYSLRFEGTWSAISHPTNFPPNPHFSGLIGTTHNASVAFWKVGDTASVGIKNMAETGSKTVLRDVFDAAVTAGSADERIDGAGIGTSPGAVTVTFRANESHPLLTVVSMLAPSPDWFVGLSGLSLRDDQGWIRHLEIDLFTYDAGTDTGIAYTSPNQATLPPGPVRALVDAPMLVDGSVPPVGRFILDLMAPTGIEETESTSSRIPRSGLSEPYPNPFSTQTGIDIHLATAGFAVLDVFDLQGRLVRHLFSGHLEAGVHFIRWLPDAAGAGIYIARLTTPTQVDTKKLIRIR
jgi:hypothetical protein